MSAGIDPRLRRKRDRLVRRISSAADRRGDVEDALDDIENELDDFIDDVEDLDEYNEELYQHTVELYEVTDDLATRLARRNREIDRETAQDMRDIADDLEDLVDDIDVDDRGKRSSLAWLLAGGFLVSTGAVGYELLDGDGTSGGQQSAGQPPALGEALKTYQFDENISTDLKDYATHLETLSDVPAEVNELGRLLDDSINANTPDDWQLGFKDNYLELDSADAKGYDSEEWGLVQLYDASPGSLKGFGELVMPKNAYQDAKDVADNWVAE